MTVLDLTTEKTPKHLSQLLLGKDHGAPADTFAKMLQERFGAAKEGDGEHKMPVILAAFKEEGMPLPKGVAEHSGSVTETTADTARGSVTEAAATLLKTDDDLDAELKLLHPNLRSRLDTEALRDVIQNAKAALKTQILKLTQPETLPTTLRGLVALAEEVGIDVGKITVETLQEASNTSRQSSAAAKTALQPQQPLFARTPAAAAPQEHTTEELVKTKTARRSAAKPAEEAPAPLRTLLREGETALPKAAAPQTSAADATAVKATAAPETALPQEKAAVTAQEPAREPVSPRPERAVQQADAAPNQPEERSIVRAAATSEQKRSGEETPRHAPAPQATPAESTAQTPAERPLFNAALNTLLRGESAEAEPLPPEEHAANDTAVPKASGSATAGISGATDPLELKIGEAKQMVRHLAAGLKEAVENYKPPFTRLKLQLNPAKLGEVDVTMIQRGNNVHINISSNATALTTLAQNASELRTQLAQNGLGNATMHFSSNAGQQQQHQPQRHAAQQYEAFESTEAFDLLDQLEIIVPRYV